MTRDDIHKGTDSTGLSKDTGAHAQPYINKDGSFNVEKKGQVKLLKDLYQYMLTVGPVRFIGFLMSYFIIVNFIYGLIWYCHYYSGSSQLVLFKLSICLRCCRKRAVLVVSPSDHYHDMLQKSLKDSMS